MTHATRISILLAAMVGTAAGGAHAFDAPKRKPGLWQIDNRMSNMPAGMGPIKQCIDEKTDNFYQQLGEVQKDKCPVMDMKNAGDKITVHSVCKVANSTATTDAVFSGRFDSDYHGDIRIKYDPPVQGMGEASMAITAKWVGPCQPGQQPGDMILPNGMKFNPQQKRGAKQ